MIVQQTYPNDPATPTAARHLCIEALSRAVDGSPVTDDVALLVTELTTNAINAGTQQVAVELVFQSSHVRLVVSDDVGGEPQVQHPAPLSTSGRGLQIVSALATRWGIDPLPRGKRVWAELPIEFGGQ